LEGSRCRLIEALSCICLEGLRKSMDNFSDTAGALAETQNENLSNTIQKHWDFEPSCLVLNGTISRHNS
jgi:hypothetical protein